MEFVKNRNKTAIIYDDIKISYNELIKKSKHYSTLLDIKKESKILIFSPNKPELIYAFLGIWEAQGTCVNIDFSYDVEELVYVLKDSNPEYIFTTKKSKDKINEAINIYGNKINIIYFEDIVIPNELPESNSINSPNKEYVALVLYTSGTTGDPKGVMLTFDNILSQVEALASFNVYEESDVFLALLPLHHIFPLLGSAIVPLYFGATIVFLKHLASEKIMVALKKYQVTTLLGVPRLYEVFHKGIIKKIHSSKIATKLFNISKNINNQKIRKILFKKVQDGFGGNIKYLISGGAKLDINIAKDFRTLGFDVLEGYGLTETSPMIAFTRPNHILPGSCGFPINDIEIKFSSKSELLVKGRNVFKGYLNKEKETKEAFTSDGYFRTGDLALLDQNGFLHITGRIKEMIVLSNGKNINPINIEKELFELSNGLIEELAVLEHDSILKTIIYPNFKKIEELKISNILETIKWNIVDKYNSKSPKHKKILNIKIVKEELPKTKLGKLRRFKLKEIFNMNEEVKKNIDEPNNKSYKILKKYLFDTTNKNIYPDNHIELDLGLDSLDLVELYAFIESSFSIRLKEKDFSTNATVEKLSIFLEKNSTNINISEMNWGEILKEDRKFSLPHSHKVMTKFKFFTKPIFKLYFRLFEKNLDKIPDGPVIFAGNHQSFLDGPILVSSLPYSKLKNTFYLAKIKHFKSDFMKNLANNSNIIVIDINENLTTTLKESAYILRKGKSLVIFPEGIRSRDGKLTDFKKSFAILSRELNVPVVPFGINGAYKAMPVNKKIPRPQKLKLNFFDPIYPKGKSVDEIVTLTKKTIETWL